MASGRLPRLGPRVRIPSPAPAVTRFSAADSGSLPARPAPDRVDATSRGDGVARRPSPFAMYRTGIGGWTCGPWRWRFYTQGRDQKQAVEFASRGAPGYAINGTTTRR